MDVPLLQNMIIIELAAHKFYTNDILLHYYKKKNRKE